MASKASIEFEKALDHKRIIPFDKGENLLKKELRAAKDDLEEALDRFKNEKYKYSTIMSYYSMFHSARALLYSKSYREKSHYYLLVAMQALFVDKGLISEKLAKEFHTAMILRESADYHGEFSKDGAKTSIDSAQNLLTVVKKILQA